MRLRRPSAKKWRGRRHQGPADGAVLRTGHDLPKAVTGVVFRPDKKFPSPHAGRSSLVSKNKNSDDELKCILYEAVPFPGAQFRTSLKGLLSLANFLAGTVDWDRLGREIHLKGTVTPDHRDAAREDPNYELTYSEIIFRIERNASVIAMTTEGPTQERFDSDTIAFSGVHGESEQFFVEYPEPQVDCVAWGGYEVNAWISNKALLSDEEFSSILNAFESSTDLVDWIDKFRVIPVYSSDVI